MVADASADSHASRRFESSLSIFSDLVSDPDTPVTAFETHFAVPVDLFDAHIAVEDVLDDPVLRICTGFDGIENCLSSALENGIAS